MEFGNGAEASLIGHSRVGHPCPFGPVDCAGTIHGALGLDKQARGRVARVAPSSTALGPVVVLVVVLASGCAHRTTEAPPGEAPVVDASHQVHVVQRGDTLYGIAWRHGLDYRDIAAANGIGPPYLIKPGQRLRLLSAGGANRAADRRAPATAAANEASRTKSTGARAPGSGPGRKDREAGAAAKAPEVARTRSARPVPGTATAMPGSWRWPVPDRPARGFDAKTTWIEYNLKPGTRIRSATDGVVAYAGPGLGGYSNLVIVKASERHLVAYAMNVAPVVGEGDTVRSGDLVAELTGSGREARRFRFEVRDRGKPVDPGRMIASWRGQAAA